ncbi:MAG TPA: ribonuclease HI family protein [Thermomicrobiales bacterium]|jgi:probable phosphoglycerate mutase|nr:hypothetical protein [Chloroflexota bacterium]HCG30595.1 hypothetical protein [Chloroflexota bacterium]HQZ90215.1 ribonuclease HI family protein [Thermomicrobiales bacterium]HRA31353.1 ribonuclease HI family protein [Thermomicrobiales bacterium]
MTAGSRSPASNQRQLLDANITLVFDGGSLGNPGKGYGSFIVQGLIETPQPVRLEFSGRRTNNEAEYMTLIEGLRQIAARAEADGHRLNAIMIRVYSDSKLVVEQVSGRWKVKSEGLRPLHAETRLLLSRFGSWELSWHPRAESVRRLGH